ncbi:HAMP domain-containing sensor histidine kinase [Bdellovibrionota bacterium FG-2]
MTQDLLDFTLIQAGKPFPLRAEKMDLATLAAETIVECSEVYGERLKLQATGEFLGYWSRSEIKRCLENLLINAVKYGTPATDITVTLGRDGDTTKIEVHHYGVGIEKEDQAVIFEYLARSSSERKSGQKGWGLGLALVQRFTLAHGGKTCVESQPGIDARFIIFLPNDSRPFLEQCSSNATPF